MSATSSWLIRVRRPIGIAALVVAACAPLAAVQAQVTLTEIKRFNLDTITSATIADGSANPRYVGNSVNSVAWNGSRLFVAGFVNSALAGYENQGIIEILNTGSTGVVTSGNVQYGNRFGFFPGINQRGYTGISLSGSRVYASLDLGSAFPASTAPGMAGYDVSGTNPVQLWALNNVRGSVHVATDPGYVVSGSSQGGGGVAWGTFGSGSTSRILSNPANGAYI
ncbi:MAG: hypothetical protein ACKO4T_03600, partial [Planctomycetaceae bacterium]